MTWRPLEAKRRIAAYRTAPDARIAARAMGILTAMNETLPTRPLDNALTVPGFETKRDAHRVVFTSTDERHRVVIWRVSGDALTKHVASLRPHARAAWGREALVASGYWPHMSRKPC